MPRLPEVTDRDSLREDQRYVFDYLAETRGGVRPPFSVILNHPEVCYRVAHVGSFARFESSLPKDVIETATCVAAREFECNFEWAAHARMAAENGVTEAAMDAITNQKGLDGLSDQEQLVIGFARQLLRDHRVDDATWNAAVAHWGAKGALELTMTVGYYAMLACLLNVTQIEPSPASPRMPGAK
jgi:4-carboxymuconolactone decarboxylase